MKVVGLTAGHWFEDSGAVASCIQENMLNLRVQGKVITTLAEAGVYVVTATGQLSNKVQQLNTYNLLAAVEIHFNAVENTTVKGAEVVYMDNNQSGKRLATLIYNSLCQLPFIDKNRKVLSMTELGRGNLFFLKSTKANAVIVEPLWLSNPLDRAKLTHENMDKIGEAIAQGILSYIA